MFWKQTETYQGHLTTLSYLCSSAVAFEAVCPSSDDLRGPESQPVVDSQHERVLGELGQDEEGKQQETRRPQVRPKRTPWHGGPLVQLCRQALLICGHGAICNISNAVKSYNSAENVIEPKYLPILHAHLTIPG